MMRKGASSKKARPKVKPERKRSRKSSGGKRPPTKKSSGGRRSTEQENARRKVLGYVQRLGKRKAARRLDLTVGQLEGFLRSRRFPPELLPEAKGLGVPGTAFTYVKGTNLAKALKRHGSKKLSTLTGLPPERLKQLRKLRPRARVKVSRDVLAKLARKLPWEKIARLLGAKKPNDVKRATVVPETEATGRLRVFVAEYGLDRAADFLGISPKTINHWLSIRTNVPLSWESFVNQKVGTKEDSGASREDLEKGTITPRPLIRLIADAWKRVQAWNKKVPRRFHIGKKTSEKWARAGEFQKNFSNIKAAYEEWKKPEQKVPPPKAPPPIPTPPPTPPTITPQPPAPLPQPPKPKPKAPPIEIALYEAMKDFEAARAEAIAQDKDARYRPHAPYGKIDYWTLARRHGVRLYEKMRKFILLINTTALGNKIIQQARKLWRLVTGPAEMMTVRFIFSAQGSGNPFYVQSFEPDKNEFSFVLRNTESIFEPRSIERAVRAILKEAWDIADSEDILLYLEHYEIVKSVNREVGEAPA